MSDKIKDGGPAFPVPSYVDGDGQAWQSKPQGMTLRDWFAGQALAGIIVATQHAEGFATTADFGVSGGPENQYRTIGRDAYAIADAMLAAREAK